MNGSVELTVKGLTMYRIAASVLMVLAASVSESAIAQQDAQSLSNDLGSVETPAPLAPPISLIPSQRSLDLSEGRDAFEVVPEGAIAVRDLDEVSTDSIGLMDVLSGGFPVDMWADTPKEMVDVLLPALPRRIPSQFARDLTKRLLLSVARPPVSSIEQDVFVDLTAIVPSATGFVPMDGADIRSDAETTVSVPEPNLGILERRLAQLALMGDWRNVRALIELVPTLSQTDEIRKTRTDLALIEGGIDAACAEAAESLSESDDPYWQKVFAFCQLRDGNVAGAFLTIDLLRELGIEDAAFFWAAEIMSGNRPITPNGLRVLTPLQLAMLRAAGRPFPSQLVRDGDPTLLRVLATAEPLFLIEEDDNEELVIERFRRALDLRLEAAEQAVSLGALDPEILRALYRAEIFEEDLIVEEEPDITMTGEGSPEEPPQTEIEEITDSGPQLDIDLDDLPVNTVLARARLFKLAEAQIIPTARAEVISRAIDFARADRGNNGPDVGTMGLIYAPLLKSLTPTGDLDWFAGNAARALISAGEISSGINWLDLTRLYARTSIEAADVAAAIWPIERQLQPAMTNRFTPLRFKRWEETRPPGLIANDKMLVLTTFAALGETVSNADWLDLMDRQARRSTVFPAPQVWHGLVDASNNARIGETVLLTLIAMGNDGPSDISPITLSHIISSLIKVGLEEDARHLAVEAAIIQGL